MTSVASPALKASLHGIGPVCAAGAGMKALSDALKSNGTPSRYEAPIDELDRLVPKRALRRVDVYSRRALLAAMLASEDAGITFDDPSRVGIVLGSGYGPQNTTFQFHDSVIDDGEIGASPTAFSHSVHNAATAHISKHLKITGPTLTLTQLIAPHVAALQTALLWLDEGRCDWVLVGLADEFSTTAAYALERFSDSLRTGKIDPLNFGACSYIPGEGAVFFLLGKRGNKGKYGTLEAPLLLDEATTSENDLTVVAAHGDTREADAYRRHLPADANVIAPAPIYGSLPTGPALALAVAAASEVDSVATLSATSQGDAHVTRLSRA